MEQSSYDIGQHSQHWGTPSGLDVAVTEMKEYLRGTRPALLAADALTTLLRTEAPIVMSMGRIAEIIESWSVETAEFNGRTVAECMTAALTRIAQAHESGALTNFTPAQFFPKIIELLRHRCPVPDLSVYDNRISQLKVHFDWGFDEQAEAVAHTLIEMEGRELSATLNHEFDAMADEMLEPHLRSSEGLFRRTLTQLRTELITDRDLNVPDALERLVENAITLFNSGDTDHSEMAFLLVREGLTLPRMSDEMRQSVRASHESTELEQRRFMHFVETEKSMSFVKAVLAHFADLQPDELLKSLRFEKDGHRRRQLLALLRMHGPDVFSMVVEEMQAAVKQKYSWYFMRNLIFLLSKVPAPGDFERYAAINLVGEQLSSKNPQLRHAALTTLNTLGGESALNFMISALDESPYRPTELLDLRLTRHIQNIVEFIARYPGEASHLVLAEIATAHRCRQFHESGKLRDVAMRELQRMSRTLSASATNLLVQHLKYELKNSGIGLAGFAIGVSTDTCLNLLAAIAGLRTAEAVLLVREIAHRFSRHIVGKRAAEILARQS